MDHALSAFAQSRPGSGATGRVESSLHPSNHAGFVTKDAGVAFAVGGAHGRVAPAGRPRGLARAAPIPRIRRDRRRDPGARHRCQQRDVHRRQRRGHAAAALRPRRSPGPHHLRFQRPRRRRPRHVAAGARRLSRSQRPVRRDRGRLGDRRQPDAGRSPGARRSPAVRARTISTCSPCGRSSDASSVPRTISAALPRSSCSAMRSGGGASTPRPTRSDTNCGSTTTGVHRRRRAAAGVPPSGTFAVLDGRRSVGANGQFRRHAISRAAAARQLLHHRRDGRAAAPGHRHRGGATRGSRRLATACGAPIPTTTRRAPPGRRVWSRCRWILSATSVRRCCCCSARSDSCC